MGDGVDKDILEAVRAMLTVLGCETALGEGGKARAELAASISYLLNVDVTALPYRAPEDAAAVLTADPWTIRVVVQLLQQPAAGAAQRLAQAINPLTLKLRPGFSRPLLTPDFTPSPPAALREHRHFIADRGTQRGGPFNEELAHDSPSRRPDDGQA